MVRSDKDKKEAKRKKELNYHRNTVDQLVTRVPKGRAAYYKEIASSVDTSFNQFAVGAMDEYISRHSLGLDIEN